MSRRGEQALDGGGERALERVADERAELRGEGAELRGERPRRNS